MKHNVIGAGRLGKNIALALTTNAIAAVDSICNRSMDSAHQACQQIGAGLAVDTLEQLPPADITWITCGDDSINTVVQNLVHTSVLKPGSLIIHCSGVLSSSILAPLKSQGCFIASIHPLKAFKAGYLASDAFSEVHCVIEGDEEACFWLNHSFERLGALLFSIPPEAKAAWHAAASMASNYLITLASCSEELLLQAGIPPRHARSMIGNLMQGNINNLQETKSIADALTGPLMRGDIETLSRHLQAIENPLTKNLYKSAGLATLPLTQLKNDTRQIIEKMLIIQ